MNDLIYRGKKIPHNGDTSSWLKAMDDNYKALMKCDEKARKKKSLVGRVFGLPVADGQALYQIVKENKTTVVVQHCTGVGDDWADHFFGYGGTFSKSLVKRYLY